MSLEIRKFYKGTIVNKGGADWDGELHPVPIAPNLTSFSGQGVQLVLGDLLKNLLAWLDQQEGVVGCVAWLTNPIVLAAINEKRFAQVVMQKEDWLRPDQGSHPAITDRALYVQDSGIDKAEIAPLDYCKDDDCDRYRVFGVVNRKDRGSRPVMHHKFLVGCRRDGWCGDPACGEADPGFEEVPGRVIETHDCECGGGDKLVPTSAWLGSFNMSKGSVQNLDSAVILGPDPAEKLFLEWRDVFIHSEALDFEATYVRPQWALGS